MIQSVFSIPCSNAYVERIFSVMNHSWTDNRNRLSEETVKAELCIRLNLSCSCEEFFENVKFKTDLLKAAKSQKKYDFIAKE